MQRKKWGSGVGRITHTHTHTHTHTLWPRAECRLGGALGPGRAEDRLYQQPSDPRVPPVLQGLYVQHLSRQCLYLPIWNHQLI